MLKEKASVAAVFGKPWEKCRVGLGKTYDTKQQVNRFWFHRERPFLADS